MRINQINTYKTFTPNTVKTSKSPNSSSLPKSPSFGGLYEINGDSIITRQQVFTMGMLMNNFWMYDARNTFLDVKLRHVYGKFNINVNDGRDYIVERILERNNIEYKKLDKK